MIQNQFDKNFSAESRNRQATESALREISEQCIECGLCVKECSFLQKYGTPKKIADDWRPQDNQALTMPFACSLCSLCTAVCPVKIDPRKMFLIMRRHVAAGAQTDFTKQRRLLQFEQRGTAKLYTFYGLPAGCDTVLFPGCALAGSRPQRVMQLFDHLQDHYPNLGIVLDCCTKPSHDLGRAAYFHAMFSEMQQYLVTSGIKNILTACPSCHAVFSRYGTKLTTRSVYEIMAGEYWQPISQSAMKPLTIHDSCVARFENGMQKSVRKLVRSRGFIVQEMKHHAVKTLCCGEGGGAHFIAPELAGSWSEIRKSETGGRQIITYCAGCAHFLGRIGSTAHLLDLLFDPAATVTGKTTVARPPFTYLHRILLKWRFKRKRRYNLRRERTFRWAE